MNKFEASLALPSEVSLCLEGEKWRFLEKVLKWSFFGFMLVVGRSSCIFSQRVKLYSNTATPSEHFTHEFPRFPLFFKGTKKQHLDSVGIDPRPMTTAMLYHKHSRRYNRLYHPNNRLYHPNVFEEIFLKVPKPETIENPYHMHWGQLKRWTYWPWFASEWIHFSVKFRLQAPLFSDVLGPKVHFVHIEEKNQSILPPWWSRSDFQVSNIHE